MSLIVTAVEYDVTYDVRSSTSSIAWQVRRCCHGDVAHVDAGAFLIRDQSWYISFA